MPLRRELYAAEWEAISREVRERAGWRCEGTPQHPKCRAANGQPHPVTGSRVVLTVAHMDGSRGNNGEPGNRPNLRALCQRCHLAWDALRNAETRAQNRWQRQNELGLEIAP